MTVIYEKMATEDWDYIRKFPGCPDKGAFEISSKRNTFFVVDGELHREDGPAWIDHDGTQAYYRNGKRHRLDGPAVVWPNGYKEYWLFGQDYSKEEWEPLAIQLSLKGQIL